MAICVIRTIYSSYDICGKMNYKWERFYCFTEWALGLFCAATWGLIKMHNIPPLYYAHAPGVEKLNVGYLVATEIFRISVSLCWKKIILDSNIAESSVSDYAHVGFNMPLGVWHNYIILLPPVSARHGIYLIMWCVKYNVGRMLQCEHARSLFCETALFRIDKHVMRSDHVLSRQWGKRLHS